VKHKTKIKMSTIKNNPLLKGASGMLGNVVVYREVRGKVIMCNRPKKSGKLTAHQEETRSRFLRGVQYARKQLATAETKAEYAAGITDSKHSAYLVALTDYLNAPTVSAVDISRYRGVVGDIIAVRASDDFKVASVQVIIRNSANEILEQGNAVLQEDSFDDWQYKAIVANATLSGTKIEVKAIDKPGNVTTAESIL
jgi:hypothetical protein